MPATAYPLLSTGAYVTTYATQAFNGFRPLAEHYV